MNHNDCINLLRNGISSQSSVWAELGSGDGAFTLALAELINPSSTIYSIDKDPRALQKQEQILKKRFPQLEVHYIAADFSRHIDLPTLDGILIANALHFIKEKEPFISMIKQYLKPAGQFVIVEYNIEQGNQWVPYPISLKSWEDLAARCGSSETRLLNTMRSKYHKEIFSAVSLF